MSGFTSSRLWPVLLVLVGLLAGALGLEVYLGGRDPRVIRVAIGANEGALVGEDDESDEGEGTLTLEKTAAVSERQAQAREAGRRGDVEKTIELLRAEIAAAESAQVRAELGYWLLIAGKAADAASELATAAQANPENPHVQLNLGVALRRTGKLDQARTALERAVQLRPSFGAARLALGVLLLRSKEFPAAIEQLKAAAGAGSNDARARASVVLGRAYMKAGQLDQAKLALERAIEWAPAVAEVRVEVGRVYLSSRKKEHRELALRVLQQAADIAPDLPQPHSLLARAHTLAGDTVAARKQFEITLQLDPSYSYARRHLLRMALAEQDFARARMHADLLLQNEVDLPEHHFLAGRVEAEAERPDEARRHYEAALAKAGGYYPEALFNLALLEKDLKHYEQAVTLYERALEQKPDYASAANNLGLAHRAKGDLVQAESAYRRATEIDPQYATAWLNLANLKEDQERYDEAIEAFTTALAIRPGYRSALLNLGVAFRHAGRLDDAIATYRRLTDQEPRYVSAWFNLGVVLGIAGRDREAREAYRQALALDEDHWASLKNLAYVEQRLGQLAEARAGYEAFLDHSPKDADVRLALAEVYVSQGDRENCFKQAQLVLSSEPGHGQAQRQLQKCKAQ